MSPFSLFARGAALFTVLTGVATWPLVARLGSHAPDHQDVYFNLWRLRWFAHALWTSPSRLFDGNQFHPERGVLAYSDAMLVQGTLAAPLLWAGVPPVLVHNLVLLGAIAASGAGAFVLARHLSGSSIGAVLGGMVFAFAPYRFEHIMHMELQWAMWMPWALWSLQRTIETGAARFGAWTGVFLALQMLSSVYYGVFLAMLLPLIAIPQLAAAGRVALSRLRALAIGAAIAAAVSWAYSIPYAAASERVGTRDALEIRTYSATPTDYLAPTEDNLLYGRLATGAPERSLLPGVLASILALAALLLAVPPVWALAYAVGLLAAFELSLGLNGWIYPTLYEHVGAVQGLRSPARASILFLLFLGVLAARGFALVTRRAGPTVRRALGAICVGVLVLEYWVAPLPLVAYDNTAPPVYAWLAWQPPGVVMEFPVPTPDRLPGDEARYAYMSTFHWKPLANGYSGYYPPTYFDRLIAVRRFPDPTALDALRRAGVRYVVVHANAFARQGERDVFLRLAGAGLWPVARFSDGRGPATVYVLE